MDDFYGLVEKSESSIFGEWLSENPRNLLMAELFLAELQARKGGKRKTCDTHSFEVNLFENLRRLRDAMWEYTYKPSRGTAHVIFKPVQREIFAAPYVDRVVHHWIVGALTDWWERRLCYDSYSCRKGRGTSFGIRRLNYRMRKVSDNFTKPCYVIKMDIRGYFMHIRRDLLYQRVMWGLNRQFKSNYNKRYKILKYVIHEVIYDDPIRDVKIQGSYEDWRGLGADKSLFCQPAGRGIVIGNLTSQFFSNIYLDVLDRFIMIDLGWKNYGRYVDDFYIVVSEEELPQTKRDIKVIGTFLEGLGMSLNPNKTKVFLPGQGVPFLGAVCRNGIIMPDKRIVRNFNVAADKMVAGDGSLESITSYLGMMKQFRSDKVVRKIFDRVGWEFNK
jgi:RNA-directed DNA polymerase